MGETPRERMIRAMVAAVAEHGYDATRVADVLELAGVSRNTFYRHFENKLDCFLAAIDDIVLRGGSAVVRAYLDHEGEWRERLGAALGTIAAAIVSYPAAARVYYVESYAAGPQAIVKLEEMSDRLVELSLRALETSAHGGMPPILMRAVLRGGRRLIQTRLREGRERELTGMVDDLLDWGLSYRTPPLPLPSGRKPSRSRLEVASGRAEDVRERILDAVLALLEERGYERVTVNDVASRAGVALSTFYDRFAGKEEAVMAALHRAVSRVIAVITPAFRGAPDWPRGIAAALDALLAYLVIEQPFAHFGGVAVHPGSRLVIDVREQMLAIGQAFIAEGYREHGEVSPVVGEAISAALDALFFEQRPDWGTDRFYDLAPYAVYLALVPFVGVDEATAIARESR